MQEVKERNVYAFRYRDDCRPPQWRHCFDGQLVVVKTEGGLIFHDSYWLHDLKPHGGDSGRRFTLKEAEEQGQIVLICNLDDIEKVQEHRTAYFADGDIFNLSYQHNCYPFFAVRKGAKRSTDKMLRVLAQLKIHAQGELEQAVDQLQRIAVIKQRIKDGFIDDVSLLS